MTEGLLPCLECKDYHKCSYGAGKEFYTYQEIRWCPYQVIYIIEHSGELLQGNWPPDPDSSSHIDPMIKTGYSSEGYYVKPVGVLAEVNYRLERCGIQGKLLRAEVSAGLELSTESKSALYYCSGWRRKRMSYQRWLRHRRYQDKKD